MASTCGVYKTLKKFQILACIGATVPVYYPLRRGLSAVGSAPPCQGGGRGFEPRSPLHAFPGRCESAFFIWRSGQVVRHGPAKPLPPVRIRASPPEKNGTRESGCPFCCAEFLSSPESPFWLHLQHRGSSGDNLSPKGTFWRGSQQYEPSGDTHGRRGVIAGDTSTRAPTRQRHPRHRSSRVRAQASPAAPRSPSPRACA